MIGRLWNRIVGIVCLPILPLLALATLWITRGSLRRVEHSYCWHLSMLTRAALSYIRYGDL